MTPKEQLLRTLETYDWDVEAMMRAGGWIAPTDESPGARALILERAAAIMLRVAKAEQDKIPR